MSKKKQNALKKLPGWFTFKQPHLQKKINFIVCPTAILCVSQWGELHFADRVLNVVLADAAANIGLLEEG